jgi:hypothetical protein
MTTTSDEKKVNREVMRRAFDAWQCHRTACTWDR